MKWADEEDHYHTSAEETQKFFLLFWELKNEIAVDF